MPTFYLDTSALLKRYKTEEGSAVIDHLFKLLDKPENRAASSILTVLEAIASARRLLKGKIIDEEGFSELIRNFSAESNRYLVLRTIDPKLFVRSIEMALAHSLRTADAIQLATALELKGALERSEEQLIFVVDDEELHKAAKSEGLETISPRARGALSKLKSLASL